MSGKWGNVPVAIASDLNCTPWSPLYRFLSSSHLDLTGLDRRRISGQEDELQAPRHKVSNRSGIKSRVSESETAGKRGSMPQGWDKLELKAASGEKHLCALHQKLKMLRSAYSEIEGRNGSRDDASGEPFLTSFHSSFSCTVDYIWHTNDLSAVRVLDTLSTISLQHDKAFSSQQWASDHLALACEFSFVASKDAEGLLST